MMTDCSGWGRDRKRQELARRLESANLMLAESRDIIAALFECRYRTEYLSDRAVRIQKQISELKRLVKQ